MAGILGVCLSACGGGASYEKPDLDERGIFRLEEVMFESSPNELQQKLANSGYTGHLINISANDPRYLEQVNGFMSDSVIRYTYNCIKQQLGDMSWLKGKLIKALDKAHDLDDAVEVTKVSTLLSGQFDYEYRTICDGDELMICTDVYVLPQMERYGFFGNPMYIVDLCNKDFLLSDCMSAVALSLLSNSDMPQQITLLDLMVMQGKILYFVDQTLPKEDEAHKMRYTQDQLCWIHANEGKVWGYILNQNLLFETDHNKFHNMIDEAPKTNAFGEGSAPRSASYIGWKIVEQYVKKSGASVKELMAEPDAQKILRVSGYHPQ